MKGPPTEAALLLLLRVKRGLLCPHPFCQFFDPIERELVSYRGRYPFIVRNLFVEIDALVAHVRLRIRALAGVCQ
jgi:hypothetical protein